MAKLETKKTETVYVLELTHTEMEALYQAIRLDTSNFNKIGQYSIAMELNDLIGGAI